MRGAIGGDRIAGAMNAIQQAALSISRVAAHLPAVRGKNRAFLELLKWAKLPDTHATIKAQLTKPIPYLSNLDLHSWLQRIAFLSGGYEPETVKFLASLHQSPGYFLDIGANIGLISIPFAKMTAAKVFAIEAVPANFEALKANIALNNLPIIPLPFAVGDEEKTVDIQVEGNVRNATGTANILADGSTYECERIALNMTTINHLIESGQIPPDCSLIKIDTDGYDLKVLEGATLLLENARPVIFGEFAAHCLNWHGQNIADVKAFAVQFGYITAARDKHCFRLDFDAASFVQDALLIPSEQRSRLAHLLNS